MIASRLGRELDDANRAASHDALLTPPAQTDVREALERLRHANLAPAVPTNATKASVKAQMAHNQIGDAFDTVLSADAVECYKPARKTYEYAAKKLRVVRAASGQALEPAQTAPDVVVASLLDAATRIVARDA
jgi:FMN phosphatase YigB (HAD superfamily)